MCKRTYECSSVETRKISGELANQVSRGSVAVKSLKKKNGKGNAREEKIARISSDTNLAFAAPKMANRLNKINLMKSETSKRILQLKNAKNQNFPQK